MLLILCTGLIAPNALVAQDSLETVIAKEGDGIISILRQNGMEVNKYYSDFYELNKENIWNGSKLKLGKTYVLPNAPDSFKNMGRMVQLTESGEIPLFNDQMAALRKKDTTLKNTVYYLLTDSYDVNDSTQLIRNLQDESDVVMSMAGQLLQRGAKVYAFENNFDESIPLSEYVEAINKRCLKNSGTYQRLIVLRINESEPSSETIVSIYDHEKSKDGKNMAKNLVNIFKKNDVRQKSKVAQTNDFTNEASVYLARNVLPITTFIEIGSPKIDEDKAAKENTNKKDFANLITTGILMDYSKLEFGDDN